MSYSNTKLLLKLLNLYCLFLSLSHCKSETTSLRTWAFHRPHLEGCCFQCFARNMSCILTEKTNASYSTYFKGFKWVRWKMSKRSLQRCDSTPHFIGEKAEAKGRSGFQEEPSELWLYCYLMKWFCLFKEISCFLLSTKHFRGVLSTPSKTNTVGVAPGGNRPGKNVSLPALVRPSPPSDPEEGHWDLLDGYGLWFPNELCKNSLIMKSSPLPSCYYLSTLNPNTCPSWVQGIGSTSGGGGRKKWGYLSSQHRHQVRTWLATEGKQDFPELLIVHLVRNAQVWASLLGLVQRLFYVANL